MCVCKSGHISTVLMLLDYGASANIEDQWRRTTLMIAASENRADLVALMVNRADVDINFVSLLGRTALSDAIGSGCDAAVQALLENGANPYLDYDMTVQAIGWSPISTVELMLRLGIVNVQYIDEDGTFLHRACKDGWVEKAYFWIDLGIALNARDCCGQTALHEAAYSCYIHSGWMQGVFLEIAGLLLEKGAHPLAEDNEGKLHLPC